LTSLLNIITHPPSLSSGPQPLIPSSTKLKDYVKLFPRQNTRDIEQDSNVVLGLHNPAMEKGK